MFLFKQRFYWNHHGRKGSTTTVSMKFFLRLLNMIAWKLEDVPCRMRSFPRFNLKRQPGKLRGDVSLHGTYEWRLPWRRHGTQSLLSRVSCLDLLGKMTEDADWIWLNQLTSDIWLLVTFLYPYCIFAIHLHIESVNRKPRCFLDKTPL